jgi:GntR family transcriptional regulator
MTMQIDQEQQQQQPPTPFTPIHRNGDARLAHERWGMGQSVWADDVRGRRLDVDQVQVTREEADQGIATALQLHESEAVCRRSRRFVVDGHPVQIAVSYLPYVLVAGSAVMSENTGPGGTYARLAVLGLKPVRFQEVMRGRAATEQEAHRLGLAPGSFVFAIRRTAFLRDGSPIEVTDIVLDASAYILEYSIRA